MEQEILQKLDYPLDHTFLMRKKKSLKRELLKQSNFIEKKIAILGGSTTAEIRDQLELFLLSGQIKPEFYESDYNRYYEDALFSEELRSFKPDIVYIHTTHRNISFKPDICDSGEQIIDKLNSEYEKLESIWNSLKNDLNCTIIQNNFDYPGNRSLGNLERSLSVGFVNFIDKLNARLSSQAEKVNYLIISDISYLSAEIGLRSWHDSSLWFNYKYALSFEGISYLSKNIANIIKAILGKSKKSLVLDLDNTLWGGVIGDDGPEKIKIGNETAIGEAYLDFQKYIKELKSRGVILNIASKNDGEIAREGLSHVDMILSESDFFSIKANWEQKDHNINNIAKEINIGLDSIVFVDDNPAEREIVKQSLNSVSVPDIGSDILNYIDHLDKNGYFEIVSLSDEDRKRNDYYKANLERENQRVKVKSYSDFLKSLEMVAEIGIVKSVYIDRITQLVNKTNQFNLTTKRYTLSDIVSMSSSEDFLILYGRLKDKFGDNGLISVIIAHKIEAELHIDLWIMSCRVLKRDMEKAMFDDLVGKASMLGLKKIIGYYSKTKKNHLVVDHYKKLGFNCISSDDGNSCWEFNVHNDYETKNTVIKLEEY